MSARAGVLALFVALGCARAAAPGPTTSSVVVDDAGSKAGLVVEPFEKDASVTRPSASPLRSVDWKDYDFGGWAGHLHEGHAESHVYGPGGGAHDTFETTLIDVAYGDVDGNAGEEAVVVLKESIWIAATSRESTHGTVHVFAWRDGAPKSIATHSMIGPPDAVRVDDGTIVIGEQSGPRHCFREMRLRNEKLVASAMSCDR